MLTQLLPSPPSALPNLPYPPPPTQASYPYGYPYGNRPSASGTETRSGSEGGCGNITNMTSKGTKGKKAGSTTSPNSSGRSSLCDAENKVEVNWG
jgi:hypothetical protein